MFLWRISNHSALDGRGGLYAPARWHSQGHPVVYLATSPAGALVEVLVEHVGEHLAPSAAVLVDGMPTTEQGKPNRRTLVHFIWGRDSLP